MTADLFSGGQPREAEGRAAGSGPVGLSWIDEYRLRYELIRLNNPSDHFVVSKSGAAYKVGLRRASSFRRSGLDVSKRGLIRCFSAKSRRRLQIYGFRARWVPKVITLLSFPSDWPVDGEQLARIRNIWLGILRETVGGHYLWWLEFQSRGAPHIHVMLEREPSPSARAQLVASWARLVGDLLSLSDDDRAKMTRFHQHSRNWQSVRKADFSYAVKYASKMWQKDIPDGYRHYGRFWAASHESVHPWDSYELTPGQLFDFAANLADLSERDVAAERLSKGPYFNHMLSRGRTAFVYFDTRPELLLFLSVYHYLRDGPYDGSRDGPYG